jgi:hypothetical protein
MRHSSCLTRIFVSRFESVYFGIPLSSTSPKQNNNFFRQTSRTPVGGPSTCLPIVRIGNTESVEFSFGKATCGPQHHLDCWFIVCKNDCHVCTVDPGLPLAASCPGTLLVPYNLPAVCM